MGIVPCGPLQTFPDQPGAEAGPSTLTVELGLIWFLSCGCLRPQKGLCREVLVSFLFMGPTEQLVSWGGLTWTWDLLWTYWTEGSVPIPFIPTWAPKVVKVLLGVEDLQV